MMAEVELRPKREIALEEYGASGVITLEPLDFVRKKQLQNNMGKTLHMKDLMNGSPDLQSQDLGDLSVYRVMAYITSAPFKFDSIDGFYNFMARLDRVRLGNADRLFDALGQACKELREESSSPLDNCQTESPQSPSESTDCQMQS